MIESEPDGVPGDAFAFEARWTEYLPIALSNLALTIVTLGIYRFWAKARERRFLWSRTRFIDDRLEWTGTGREMFIGALMVMLVFLPIALFFNLGMQAMVARGHGLAAGIIAIILYAALLWLIGLAKFRSLRYRLSRTWWHGIRGGSDDPGFGYALSAFWKTLVAIVSMGLMVPWMMTSLYRERWRAMSFGGTRFWAEATERGLMRRWLLVLAVPFLMIFAIIAVAATLFAAAAATGRMPRPEDHVGSVIAIVAMILAIYPAIAVAGLAYYAKFYRRTIGGLELGTLQFEFTARTRHWFLLLLGDIALVIGTLGVGIAFLGYRHWSFFIRHMGAVGEVDLAALTRSQAHAPREAEGFADAFDFGAI